jgi:protein O-GlcNAc transferase
MRPTMAVKVADSRATQADVRSASNTVTRADADDLLPCHAALEQAPTSAEGWCAWGAILQDRNELDGAMDAYRTATGLDARLAAAYAGLADVSLKKDRPVDALAYGETAALLGRGTPQSLVFLVIGRSHHALGQNDQARIALLKAIDLDPRDPNAYVALGLVFEDQSRLSDAFNAYQKALSLNPREVSAYNNLAGVLIGMKQLDLAVGTAQLAVSLAPENPEVYLNLALALRLRGDEEEALATYKKIVAIKPDHGKALIELCHYRQHACDWDGLEAQRVASHIHSYRKGFVVSPFSVMTSTTSPWDQLACAQVWAEHLSPMSRAPLASYEPRPHEKRGDRLRLGYLSSDFHHHATAMLIADLLEQHDKTKFELFGYSLGVDDGSAMRQRLINAFETFRDFRDCSDSEAARLIREDEIDILLDLKGFTQNARLKILASRPAPIQVNYLGFPGTMGVPFIDYMIADAFVAPIAHEAHFSEKIVQLPHCYQPNDRKRPLPSGRSSRAAHNLPADAFVFCCFNNSYKITPDIFDIWMRLLASKAGSVLWLLDANRQAATNLRQQAEVRGIAADRLVFAPFVSAEDHLARYALADLFLDTFPVNAHTTASEALWVGVPLVTCSGETFASRVAGSLLHAIGLPETIAESLSAYEVLAQSLAHDPTRLEHLRETLSSYRLKQPLFDTPRYARNFEKALLQMQRRRDLAQAPEAFSLTE